MLLLFGNMCGEARKSWKAHVMEVKDEGSIQNCYKIAYDKKAYATVLNYGDHVLVRNLRERWTRKA